MGSVGSTGTPGKLGRTGTVGRDAEAGEAEQGFSGSPTAEPLNRSPSYRFFQSTTTAVRQAFQVWCLWCENVVLWLFQSTSIAVRQAFQMWVPWACDSVSLCDVQPAAVRVPS